MAEKKARLQEGQYKWYFPLEDLPAPIRELLETYSGVAPKDIEGHILAMREKAWRIHPYPCIGMFSFIKLSLRASPEFPEVVERLKTGKEQFLDLGCCVGQELRSLLAAGVPANVLHGADLDSGFIELGYELFRDREKASAVRFTAADIFDSSQWTELQGRMNIVHAQSFLHLWDLEKQKIVCEKIVKLLAPLPGSLLIGRQVAGLYAGERDSSPQHRRKMYLHNNDSFAKMWEEIGARTDSRWKVESRLATLEEVGGHHFKMVAETRSDEQPLRVIFFSVRRL